MIEKEQPLRDVVAGELAEHWLSWSVAHPQLAEAIDRLRLIELTVEQLRQDPAFTRALRECELDELRLAQAAGVLDLARRQIRRLLPL